MSIKIEIGNAEDIVAVSKQIPEFERATTLERLQSKLDGVVGLILVAKFAGIIVGYKVGYQLTADTFYSWLGGVMPEYRKHGIATLLLKHQEKWALNSGYKQIKVKSMNRYPDMLKLLISNSYEIVAVEDNVSGAEGKIVFLKRLAVDA